MRKFSGTATQDVFVPFQVPPDLNGTSFKFRVIFFITETAPSNKGVAFYLKGMSMGDGDPLSGALGSAVKSSITGRSDAQYDRVATVLSGDVTITNLASGETVMLNLYRTSGGDDNYDQKVGVFGVEFQYSRTLA